MKSLNNAAQDASGTESINQPYSSKQDEKNGIATPLLEGQDVEIIEVDKSGNVQQQWIHQPDNKIIQLPSANSGHIRLRSWRKGVFDAFLPVGFPHSVSEDYLAYQTYDSLQAFFSTITSLLASRALLQGLGVGDASSSATFAMLLTILKDAMSRVATIFFAQRFGLRIEPDAKRFRFLADLFNDTAFFLELYSPYFGSAGKVVALGIGEALRALCGVAAGASKAALSVHFARHDNLAELNAKEASQETAVGLIGLLVGTLVVKSIEDHTSVVCLTIVLVLGHLWVNYLGVCSVYMTTLNRQRATILFSEYLQSGKVLSPKEVANKENVLFWETRVRNRDGHLVAGIKFAESYQDAMNTNNNRKTLRIIDDIKSTIYIATSKATGFSDIRIMLWEGACPSSAIGAWFKAMEISWMMKKGEGYSDDLHKLVRGIEYHDSSRNWGDGESAPTRAFDASKLWDGMKATGWNLDAQAFETSAPVRLRVQLLHKKRQ